MDLEIRYLFTAFLIILVYIRLISVTCLTVSFVWGSFFPRAILPLRDASSLFSASVPILR